MSETPVVFENDFINVKVIKTIEANIGNTVFFLGAGATIDVVPDAPSNKTLVKKALENFGDSLAGQRVRNFIADLFKREDPPIDNQIWNLLDYIAQQEKSPSTKYNLESILNFREDLLELIIREFQRSLNSQLIVNDTYGKFVRLINGLVDTQVAIISTNYDIFVDNELKGCGQKNYGAKIRYPIAGRTNIRSSFKRPELSGDMGLNTGRIKLFKIHGSLNWLYCKKCDEVDIIIGEKFNADDIKELYCVREECTNKYEPLLITPTMFKNYENRIIKETWDLAEKELTAADNIVFIGYALKDEDYHIRCLLMKALLNRANKYKKIIVIERKPKDRDEEMQIRKDVKSKYKELYGKIDFRPIGFSNYITTGNIL